MELAIKVLQKDIKVLDILILENKTPEYNVEWNADRLQLEAAIVILKLEQYTNQRVVEELERQMELAEVGNSYTRLRDRIKELKQE